MVAVAGAKIGNQAFATITDALAAAQSGDTVTALADAQLASITVPTGVTLDLNNKTVQAAAIENNGMIVIYDAATIDKITGAAGSTVKIVTPYNEGKLDITAAFVVNPETGVIALDETPGAKVLVGDEQIPVQPTLTEADDATTPPLTVGETTAVGVKAIPGLTYELVRSTTIGGVQTTVASEKATTSRVTLTDTFTEATGGKPASAFYVIQVKK